jgi:hypothetical protein
MVGGLFDPFSPTMRTTGQYMKEVVMPTPNSPVRPIPSHPNLEHDRKRAKSLLRAARSGDADVFRLFRSLHPRAAAMDDPASLKFSDAQLVVAREYGFVSWPQWKQFVDSRQLDRAQRAAELVKAACSNDVRKARLLLETEPELASFDLYTACACGELAAVERFLVRDPSLTSQKGGPLDHEPILYACFSRFMRSDPKRRDGIVRAVRMLLDRGADPNAFYWMESEGERWFQSALYGASGIGND